MYSGISNKGWYVLYTKPRHEKKVFDQLSNRFEVYLPLRRELRQWSDRKKWVEVPLFTSYVFVNIGDMKEYHATIQTNGAICFITFNGRVAQVRDEEIHQIKYLLKDFEDVTLAPSDLKIGETRKITNGPLMGYDCEIIKYGGKDKIIVRLDSLNQNLVAEIDATHFHF